MGKRYTTGNVRVWTEEELEVVDILIQNIKSLKNTATMIHRHGMVSDMETFAIHLDMVEKVLKGLQKGAYVE